MTSIRQLRFLTIPAEPRSPADGLARLTPRPLSACSPERPVLESRRRHIGVEPRAAPFLHGAARAHAHVHQGRAGHLPVRHEEWLVPVRHLRRGASHALGVLGAPRTGSSRRGRAAGRIRCQRRGGARPRSGGRELMATSRCVTRRDGCA